MYYNIEQLYHYIEQEMKYADSRRKKKNAGDIPERSF